ncbi:MAG: DNA methyltransferase [Verrucomicrobiota bacterium]
MMCTKNTGLHAATPRLELEDRIVHRLQNIAKGTTDYWDFRDGAEDLASKCLFQYPAMMVPAMQKQVIRSILKVHPAVNTIADPFLGSGTILALAMLSGRDFIGQDVNPLAILIAKTRAFSLDHESLAAAVECVKTFARLDTSVCYDVQFKRQAKWFTRGANIGLSRLRRAIRTKQDVNTRRFLWVCLAEAIRLNSNSRTSTYKLHVRPESERNAKIEDVLTSFASIAEKNLKVVSEFRTELLKSGHLDEAGNYKKSVNIFYGDTTKTFPPILGSKYQALVTSPPYGDNKTTVPYGQAAWLPLQWIDLSDIDKTIPASAVAGYYDVDNRSLGGTRPRDFRSRQEILESVSPCAKDYISKLSAKSRDGLSRFVNFTFDLRSAISQFAANCDEGGYIVLTLGNRNICKTVCPLNDLCSEFIGSHNAKEVFRITRQIPSKRMPGKNGHSSTINQEYITVFRKATPTPAQP